MKTPANHRPSAPCVPADTSRAAESTLPTTAVSAAAHERLRVLRLPDVCRVTGLCRSMVYRLEAERKFPRRVRITMRTVGWLEGEVQAWLAERIEQHRARRSV